MPFLVMYWNEWHRVFLHWDLWRKEFFLSRFLGLLMLVPALGTERLIHLMLLLLNVDIKAMHDAFAQLGLRAGYRTCFLFTRRLSPSLALRLGL